MDNAFQISTVLFVLIVLYEFFNRIVIDLGFVSVIARNKHTTPKLFFLLLVQLSIWIVASAVFWPLFRWTLEDRHGSTKGYGFIIFIVVVLPIILIRKPYAKWVGKMSNKSNELS